MRRNALESGKADPRPSGILLQSKAYLMFLPEVFQISVAMSGDCSADAAAVVARGLAECEQCKRATLQSGP